MKGASKMNPGQEMFYNFYMERVKDDKKGEAEALLKDSFARQADSTFDKAYLEQIIPKMLSLVKPEATPEVKQAMEHFASTL